MNVRRGIASGAAGGLLAGLLLGLVTVAVGCKGGGSLPKTYKVTGKVIHKGGKSVKDGGVQFSSLTDSSFTVSGDLAEDGSFTLRTFKGRERADGAPEGEYKVTILMPQSSDQRGVPAIELPKRYQVEPKDNDLVLEIPAR